MQPLQDWALIEPSEAKEQTAGGLFIPDTAKEKPVEGKVLAVGKGRWDIPEKSLAVNPTRKRKKSSSPRSSNLAIRSSTRNTERPRSIWTVRNSFSSASPTSWAGWGKKGRLGFSLDRAPHRGVLFWGVGLSRFDEQRGRQSLF